MSTMNNKFSSDELKQIDQADDLKISPLRNDGVTFGTPTWIWAVVVNGDLYVRAYNGKRSRWYQSAIQQHAGRIHAAGLVEDVVFEQVASDLDAVIDEAYKAKYSKSPYLSPMIGAGPKQATIRILRK